MLKGWFEDAEGNRQPDRRGQPTPFLSRYSWFGGKRRGPENGSPRGKSYVDIYSFRGWVLLSSFLFLNLLDGHFTVIYLQRGGVEANPVVSGLLLAGLETFFVVKALVIGFGILLFCVLKNFPNARLGVLVSLFFYQALLLYHLLLYGNLMGMELLP
jgi:hypothetical protein